MADAAQIADIVRAAVEAATLGIVQNIIPALLPPPQANPVAAAVPPAVPVQFARTPAQAFTGLLDYANTVHHKVYKNASAPLATRFNHKNPDINILRTEFRARADEFALSNIFEVDISPQGEPPQMRSLLTHHGEVTLEQATRHAMAVIQASDRSSQNDTMALNCLKASVVEATTTLMSTEAAHYTSGANNNVESGILYYKILLSKAEIDTRATASITRTNLYCLPQYMKEEAKEDISAFNAYVKAQMETLVSRGETCSDVLDHIFRAYAACQDHDFHDFVRDAQRRHNLGEITYNWETLMASGETLYLTSKRLTTWMTKTPEQQELIALRAEASLKQKGDYKPKMKQGGGPASSKGKAKQGTKKANFKGDQAWRMVRGTGPETRTVNGSQWKWCSHHPFWCDHHVAQCRSKAKANERSGTMNSRPGVTLQASMAAVGIQDIQGEQDYDDCGSL